MWSRGCFVFQLVVVEQSPVGKNSSTGKRIWEKISQGSSLQRPPAHSFSGTQ